MRFFLIIFILFVFSCSSGSSEISTGRVGYVVEPQKCDGCGICVNVCPAQAIFIQKGKAVIDPQKCVNCGICAQRCPQKAIQFQLGGSK